MARTSSQADGRFALPVPEGIPQQAELHIERAHFSTQIVQLTQEQLDGMRAGQSVSVEQIVLEREIGPSFWIATALFVVMLLLIATGFLHNTLAALVGASLLYAFSYLGHLIREDLFVFDFTTSLRYVDWNVIFLIMGMMIVIAVVENTGIFQWLAFFAYRISGGHTFILLLILMLITGVASAFLDNVTTMLLMTPITVQIAIALGINPLALLIPEVMASNVIGVSTLVGTPTNILIGSYGEISFTDFLTNLTPGVLLAFIGLLVYCAWIYRKELGAAKEPSALLLEKLAERGAFHDRSQHLLHSRNAAGCGLSHHNSAWCGYQSALLLPIYRIRYGRKWVSHRGLCKHGHSRNCGIGRVPDIVWCVLKTGHACVVHYRRFGERLAPVEISLSMVRCSPAHPVGPFAA